MDHNSEYVIAAYVIVAAGLSGYATWLVARLRRAERAESRPDA